MIILLLSSSFIAQVLYECIISLKNVVCGMGTVCPLHLDRCIEREPFEIVILFIFSAHVSSYGIMWCGWCRKAFRAKEEVFRKGKLRAIFSSIVITLMLKTKFLLCAAVMQVHTYTVILL